MMAGTQLPPGLRFHPTDVELIKYYLKRRVLGKKLHFQGILELDIYKHSPWDLPDKSGWRSGDLKWYFFCPRERKYASGARMNRNTDRGYWKTTGKDRSVSYNNEVVGMIKTLVFHQGKPPKGERTDWVMYEYRLQEKELAEKGIAQDAYVLCSIFKKEGPGPRNGAQYGAPFREEDWNDDDDDDTSSIVSEAHGEQSAVTTTPVAILPLQQPPQTVLADEIGEMLNMFSEEGVSVPYVFHNNEMMDCPVAAQNVEADPYADGIDIFGDLGDLGSLVGFGEPAADNTTSCNSMYPANSMVYGDDAPFVELIDLDLPFDKYAKQPEYSHAQAAGFCAGKNIDASGDSIGACGSRIGSHLVTPGGLYPLICPGDPVSLTITDIYLAWGTVENS